VDALAKEFPDVSVDYQHVDAASMFFVTAPERFDVIVTDNLFGDILTDLGAAIAGGIGLAASGNINPDRTAPSMFEPVHGSAPPLAGKNVANPMGAILSVALMLEHLGLRQEAAAVETAVRQAVVARQGTSDIGGSLGTRETGDGIAKAIRMAKG
jgi:3-isopropylmalate dehydrogenase